MGYLFSENRKVQLVGNKKFVQLLVHTKPGNLSKRGNEMRLSLIPQPSLGNFISGEHIASHFTLYT